MDPTSIDTLSQFSQSCGTGSLHLELFEDGGNVGEQRSFDPPFFVVGRSPDADLRLDHDHVSWRHCYLQMIGGQLVSIDLDSHTGVLLDGVPQRIGWITPENRLRIGPVTFRLQGQDEETEARGAGPGEGGSRPHPLSAQFARHLPSAALEIEGAGGQAYGWRMSRALALIGRSSACQVRLMNASISKFHAALVRTPAGVWIVDLLSREGIEVDGSQVRVARLDEGSVCQVGTFTLRLRSGTHAPPPPRRTDRSRSLPAPAAPQGARPGSVPSANADGRSLLRATPAGGAASTPLAPAWPTSLSGNEPDLRASWNPSAQEPGLDPSQQAMMMLAQMLGTMHRDHMSHVRDELAEIRRLAEEMYALRKELSRRPAGAVAPAPASLIGTASPELAPSAMAADGGDTVPGGEPADAPPAQPRDPRECLAIASRFLASYERKQEGHWARILRIVTGYSRDQEPGRGSLEQAPLG